MVLVLGSVLLFALAATCTAHLRFAAHAAAHARARALAESAVAQVLVLVSREPEYGRAGTETVRIPGLPDGQRGLVTFDETLASRENVAYSTSNVQAEGEVALGESLKGFRKRPVPPGCVHVVGFGQCGSQAARAAS